MTQHLSWCAVAVSLAPFELMQLQQFASSVKVTSGLVIGKSLRCLAIVVENLFRPYSGRLGVRQFNRSMVTLPRIEYSRNEPHYAVQDETIFDT